METENNMESKPGYAEMLAEIRAAVTPVEIAAEAGDCCFWHLRSVQSAGVNTLSQLRNVVCSIVHTKSAGLMATKWIFCPLKRARFLPS